jgi:subtilase-type serine protease
MVFFVLDGGIVSGTGTIEAPYGFYHLAGTIKPGNSIGTLTITGDYYQEPQAKLLIEVASPTSNDVLAITGDASLSGILQTSWQGGATPAIGTKFGAFLTAAGGVTGRFTSLLTNITPTVVFSRNTTSPTRCTLWSSVTT